MLQRILRVYNLFAQTGASMGAMKSWTKVKKKKQGRGEEEGGKGYQTPIKAVGEIQQRL